MLYIDVWGPTYYYCGNYYGGDIVYYGYDAPGGYIGGGDWVTVEQYNTTIINEYNNTEITNVEIDNTEINNTEINNEVNDNESTSGGGE